jgi:hypothetical protein
MANYEWQRQTDASWPPIGEGDPMAPGRIQGPEPGDRSTLAEFNSRRRELITRLGSGGGQNNPTNIVDLPPETPSPDACAYYLSFRFGTQWGIYIGVECWFNVAKFLHRNGVSASAAVDEAFEMLFRHESFHYEVDKQVLLLERAAGQSTGRFVDHWLPHLRTNNPSYLEEALANAHAFKYVGKAAKRATSDDPKRLKLLLAAWMKRQPPGYRDFHKFATKKVQVLASSQHLSAIMGVHRNDHSYVHGLGEILDRKDKANKPADIFNLKLDFDDGVELPLGIYFF